MYEHVFFLSLESESFFLGSKGTCSFRSTRTMVCFCFLCEQEVVNLFCENAEMDWNVNLQICIRWIYYIYDSIHKISCNFSDNLYNSNGNCESHESPKSSRSHSMPISQGHVPMLQRAGTTLFITRQTCRICKCVGVDIERYGIGSLLYFVGGRGVGVV